MTDGNWHQCSERANHRGPAPLIRQAAVLNPPPRFWRVGRVCVCVCMYEMALLTSASVKLAFFWWKHRLERERERERKRERERERERGWLVTAAMPGFDLIAAPLLGITAKLSNIQNRGKTPEEWQREREREMMDRFTPPSLTIFHWSTNTMLITHSKHCCSVAHA